MADEPFGVTLRRARAAMADFRASHKVRVEPTESGRRFVTVCSCGYRSTTRSSVKEATKTGIWHLSRAGDEFDAQLAAQNGVSVPETVSGPVQHPVTG